jgi:D-alanyl-D-alanine carboxypeptidase/D-alanyl-D-alanine-endopeptidase (penicillin-binding protein 4)
VAGIVLVVVVLVAAAAVVFWPKLTGSDQADVPTQTTAATPGGPTTTVADPPVSAATARIEPMKPSGKVPTPAGIAKALAKPLANPKLAQFTGIVIDPVTGKTLWQQDPTTPQIPASSMKLLTGAALLTSTDPNSRLVTTVVQGEDPGQIVFVGGGGVTLSARPEGTATVTPGAATVADLAAQVKATGVKVTSILLDTSYWSGPDLADGWKQEDIRGTAQVAQGFITHMSPLMVDGDRQNPAVEDSPRTGDPAMTAGKALARALGVEDVPITEGTAPPDAEVLARVSSQPLSTLLAQALENSDNVLAEALARQVAIARGAPPSFVGVSAAILQALQDMGIDTIGVVVKDGSGMSDQDRVPPEVLAQIMSQAVAGKDPVMRTLLTGLPLAGVSGTLADRFKQPDSKAGAGWVRAKTGSIDVTYALVGYVPDVDGRILVFAFNSNGVLGNDTRYAQDALAATLRGCGCTG